MTMKKKYYEVVFEGSYRAIFAFLEGYMLGKGMRWSFFFSKTAGIRTETMSEALIEWITLQNRLHHVIMDEEMYNQLAADISSRDDLRISSPRYIRSAKEVKQTSFRFSARTYGRKYGNEIKAMIQNLPQGLELHEYSPMERIDPEAAGTELYTPEHEYIFEATGKITGDLKEMILFRNRMCDHPLIEVREIKIRF